MSTKKLSRLAGIMISVCLGTASLGSPGLPVASASQTQAGKSVTVTVGGQSVAWTTKPLIYRGVTYAPLREAAEYLGAEVRWNTTKRAAELRVHGDTILHRTGTDLFSVNGNPLRIGVNSLDQGGVTLVPLRALAEVLKAEVDAVAMSGTMHVALTPDAATIRSSETEVADRYLQAQKYSGIAMIAKGDQILLRKGYGYDGDNQLVRADQKSRIGSLTKSFTAAAVMKLAEEGKLHLDDTLESYFPGFPSGDRITIHLLLSHLSGINPNFPRVAGLSLQDTIEAIRSKPLLSEPGSKFMYSNSGYVVLAGIIEKASGMSYGEYLKQSIWEPLGLKDTGEAKPSIPVLQGYVSAGDQLWAPAGPYISQSGTGTLYSTANDMLTWIASFETERVLSQASIDQMFTPYSEKNYGYGWMIQQENGTTRVFHNGSGTGYATGMSRELGGGYTIILLGNHAGMDTLTLMTELRMQLP
ncbi:serine hydrolase [Paenibacillus barengoltzii]|uniref:CubicO group peptidase, beta-lactamase class C family n=1 Tax=Paenibacillus barengoltzii J12 TaxID=935846 RepID=A0ABY1LWM9_9BACL|nr:serine hydrolase [Paenibacillus barengoltzii]SMF21093.1 CubicO group peptidase, beta-lactamase class C family [Paenibacillus barengoltzii J12]